MFLPLIVLAVLVILAWRMAWENTAFLLSHQRINLRKSLRHPARILHLSDIHFSGPAPKLDCLFDRLGTERYDFIFVTGDIIDCPEGIQPCLKNLCKLRAEKGIFAVLGNHDYFDYHLVDIIFHNFLSRKRPAKMQPTHLLIKTLERSGIHVLRNETAAVSHQGTQFLIHGMDDATIGRANARMAMAHYDPTKINILLTHNLDVFLDIGRDEIDLAFSGHTHGGQFRLPFWGAFYTHTKTGRKYASGLKKIKGAICSVSRGLGSSRYVPFRFLCRPEAIVLNVRGKA
jgi:predicted MPP superfamily phosphohydrolase